MKIRWCVLPLFLLVWSAAANALDAVDTTQSQAMIDFLDSCHEGTVQTAAIEQVMKLPGTQLVIAQQNISRRISATQYGDFGFRVPWRDCPPATFRTRGTCRERR